MAVRYETDRFDDIPADLDRVGAHRAPKRRGRGWITFGWALLATVVLIGVGLFGLSVLDRQVADTGTAPTAVATVQPTTDAKIQVVLLNAAATDGLAASAKSKLTKAGWNVVSTLNASSTTNTSAVYYLNTGAAGAAAGLAKALGITRTAESQQYAAGGSSRITVVLGKDYAAKQ